MHSQPLLANCRRFIQKFSEISSFRVVTHEQLFEISISGSWTRPIPGKPSVRKIFEKWSGCVFPTSVCLTPRNTKFFVLDEFFQKSASAMLQNSGIDYWMSFPIIGPAHHEPLMTRKTPENPEKVLDEFSMQYKRMTYEKINLRALFFCFKLNEGDKQPQMYSGLTLGDCPQGLMRIIQQSYPYNWEYIINFILI